MSNIWNSKCVGFSDTPLQLWGVHSEEYIVFCLYWSQLFTKLVLCATLCNIGFMFEAWLELRLDAWKYKYGVKCVDFRALVPFWTKAAVTQKSTKGYCCRWQGGENTSTSELKFMGWFVSFIYLTKVHHMHFKNTNSSVSEHQCHWYLCVPPHMLRGKASAGCLSCSMSRTSHNRKQTGIKCFTKLWRLCLKGSLFRTMNKICFKSAGSQSRRAESWGQEITGKLQGHRQAGHVFQAFNRHKDNTDHPAKKTKVGSTQPDSTLATMLINFFTLIVEKDCRPL